MLEQRQKKKKKTLQAIKGNNSQDANKKMKGASSNNTANHFLEFIKGKVYIANGVPHQIKHPWETSNQPWVGEYIMLTVANRDHELIIGKNGTGVAH